MYFELAQLGASCSGEKFPWPYRPKHTEETLALAAEMSRYDPRLLGILVELLVHHAHRFSPQMIRAQYRLMSAPQTFAVIAEFVKTAAQDPEVIYLMEYLQKGLKPVSPQLYYKTIYSPGGKLSQRAAEEPLAQYKKWGFLAREAPTVDVYQKKTVGHFDRDSRINILKRLFQEQGVLQLKDYLKAIGQTISRQQALKDLEAVAKLRRGTRGPGATWEPKKD
jgi:hypothetical protein